MRTLIELAKAASEELKVGNPRTVATDTYAHHNKLIHELDAAIDQPTCQWYEGDDGGPWATQCNELFNIECDGPEANSMKFCCFCGKKLVEVVAEVEDEEDEE